MNMESLLYRRAGRAATGLLICGALLSMVRAQSPPNLASLIAGLKSETWQARERAFYAIEAVPHADTEPEVQAALVQLLLKEEDTCDAAWVKDPLGGPDSVYGEGFQAGYLNDLLGVVEAYARLTNSEDRATAIALLRTIGGPPGDDLHMWLASRSGLTAADVINLSKSTIWPYRFYANGTLASLLIAAHNGRRQLSEDETKTVKQALIAGLKDPDPNVRADAADHMGALHYADPDILSALATAAGSDPSQMVRMRAGRDHAALAGGR